jgi:hypothetical protein
MDSIIDLLDTDFIDGRINIFGKCYTHLRHITVSTIGGGCRVKELLDLGINVGNRRGGLGLFLLFFTEGSGT